MVVALLGKDRALSSCSLPWNATTDCSHAQRLHGLHPRQLQLCRTRLGAMAHAVEASRLAVSACQSAFRDRRWNCSSVLKAPELMADLTAGRPLALSLLICLPIYPSLCRRNSFQVKELQSLSVCLYLSVMWQKVLPLTRITFFIKQNVLTFKSEVAGWTGHLQPRLHVPVA